MASTFRITREVLEYALDLPVGVTIAPGNITTRTVEGVEVIEFPYTSTGEHLLGGQDYALQYEEGDAGLLCTAVIPLD